MFELILMVTNDTKFSLQLCVASIDDKHGKLQRLQCDMGLETPESYYTEPNAEYHFENCHNVIDGRTRTLNSIDNSIRLDTRYTFFALLLKAARG